jgi:hypothetical protein
MSAVALDTPVRPAAGPRGVLRAVAHDAADDAADVQLWEAHSELSLVSSEVRQRLLELLPERDAYSVPPLPRTSVPLPVAPQKEEPGVRARDLLRYTVRRVGEMVRLGLAIVGAIFVLALLAEVLSR